MTDNRTPRQAPPDEAYYRRREQTRRWGTILLLAGVVWLVFELTSRGSIFGLGLGFVERSVDLPSQSLAAARLELRGVSDNVELIGWGGSEIRVEAVKHGFGWNAAAADDALARIDLQVRRDGDTLRVEVQRQGGIGVIGRSPYLDLRISLPAGVALDVATVSGDLRADGIQADGALATVSGDITVADSAGALQISTTSGEVRAEGALSRPRVETVSGDISLSGGAGPLYARSISGDISLDGLDGAQLDLESTSGDIEVGGSLASGAASRISSISGDVQVGLSALADLRLEASTTSGDLSSDLDLREAQRERRRLSGVLGAGTTALTVSTTSGDVEVNGP